MQIPVAKSRPLRYLLLLWLIAAFMLLSGSVSFAQSNIPATSLDQLSYLEGNWIGEGGGNEPGQGIGGFSFVSDLQGNIMVRKSYADYPATEDKPAYRHEDLMVLYQEGKPSPIRAIYFDSEGHVINYTVEISGDNAGVIFTSDDSSPGPRFRLTYKKIDEGNLGIKFEIAPPGNPDAYSTYIEASAHRK